MEQWYVVVDADNRAVSIGTVLADPLPPGMLAVPLDEADTAAILDGSARWDPAWGIVARQEPNTP